jgi:hypothetical protein
MKLSQLEISEFNLNFQLEDQLEPTTPDLRLGVPVTLNTQCNWHDWSVRDIWNVDTYDVVVFLRYRTSSSTISGLQRY